MIKAIRTEQFLKRTPDNQFHTQENGKNVGDGHGKNQPIDPFRLPDTGFIQVKAPAFDISVKWQLEITSTTIRNAHNGWIGLSDLADEKIVVVVEKASPLSEK